MESDYVRCHICGKRYSYLDPNVIPLAIDRAWSCADESACFERRAAAVDPRGVSGA